MNKLVRDNIPKFIPATESHSFKFTPLAEPEYGEELKKKLVEEVEEYLQSENAEELADIYEVLEAIIKLKSFDFEEIKRIKQKKHDQRGGFEKRLFMERIKQ